MEESVIAINHKWILPNEYFNGMKIDVLEKSDVVVARKDVHEQLLSQYVKSKV